jgi:hypothetical protein
MTVRHRSFGAIDLRALLLLALLAVAARVQTFGNPVLGYDEQYYLLVGDRMLHGALPYLDIFDRKPIGLFLIFAGVRLLGGEGVLAYQMVALACVIATAWLIVRMARSYVDEFAAITAGCLYVLWLNFAEGEGGQSPVFYNLPMALAATLVWRASSEQRALLVRGAMAMLLTGIAMQIKYPALVEGMFFGGLLLSEVWLVEKRWPALVVPALVWIGAALLPTVLAMLVFWHLGALQPFLFANFLSQFGRLQDPAFAQFNGLLAMIGILTPFALLVWRGRAWARPGGEFFMLWLAAALLSVLVFASYLSPHYLMPVFVPMALAAAPCFVREKRGRVVAAVVLVFFFALGQVVLAKIYQGKGGRREAMLVAAAARPRHGCLYVYDGFPALYFLTNSCLPTRWAFPGLLNTHSEASAAAIGVDPLVEVRRILAARPEVIVDTDPPYFLGNPVTHAELRRVLARDYVLTYNLTTGAGEHRLVFRRKDHPAPVRGDGRVR